MLGDFNLRQLPPCGKTFVALFVVLVLLILSWMTIIGFMEADWIGDSEKPLTYDEYDVSADITTIMDDEEAVTPPIWADSGQQQPIDESDLERFRGVETVEAISKWKKFEDNMKWALEHISSMALLYFALGLLFMLTPVSAGTRKFFFWIAAVLLFLHVLGLSGHGFCWPADLLTWICGPLILIVFFVMALIILARLKAK